MLFAFTQESTMVQPVSWEASFQPAAQDGGPGKTRVQSTVNQFSPFGDGSLSFWQYVLA